jgi:hypothetical protein
MFGGILAIPSFIATFETKVYGVILGRKTGTFKTCESAVF